MERERKRGGERKEGRLRNVLICGLGKIAHSIQGEKLVINNKQALEAGTGVKDTQHMHSHLFLSACLSTFFSFTPMCTIWLHLITGFPHIVG